MNTTIDITNKRKQYTKEQLLTWAKENNYLSESTYFTSRGYSDADYLEYKESINNSNFIVKSENGLLFFETIQAAFSCIANNPTLQNDCRLISRDGFITIYRKDNTIVECTFQNENHSIEFRCDDNKFRLVEVNTFINELD